jgi:stearoyl-CoA desaturase (delta-9 desaturase)
MKRATFTAWFDSSLAPAAGADDRIDWVRCLPFIGIHLLCLAAIWTGVEAAA